MKGSEIVNMLKKRGWSLKRIRGSHYVMESPDSKITLPIPCHNTDLRIGMLNKILKDTGLKNEK